MSAMDEEEGWMMVTWRRWKKRRTFPLYLIAQESKEAKNQIQPLSRERRDKRQGRLRTKMFDNSTQTQKPWKLITLEEFFPRQFFQNDSTEVVQTVSRYEIHDKKEDVDHGCPSEALTSLKEPQSQGDEVEPSQSSTHQKKCSPKLLKSQRCTLLLPTRFNKPRNVMHAFQT